MTCSSTEGQGGTHMEANLIASFARAYFSSSGLLSTTSQSQSRPRKRKFAAIAESLTHPASTSLLTESGGRPQKRATKVASVSESSFSTEVEPMSIESVGRLQERSTKVASVSETEVQPMETDDWESPLVDMDLDDEEHGETSIPDIDKDDSADPLAVVQYPKEIHEFYWRAEGQSCVNPFYMSNQPDINEKMRAVLIDWLVEVHDKLQLQDETLFLTVNLVDRFLAIQNISRNKLQLVGVTALRLACKYEKVTVWPLEDFIEICVCAYTRAELLEMERLMLNTLQFNMSVPTPYVFLKRFLKAAKSDRKMELLCFYIAELCLVDFRMLQFNPSILAAAAVFTAQCTMSGCPIWSKCSEKHSGYTQDQLIECSSLMVELHHKSGQGKLTGVYRKFCTPRFGFPTKSKPALFLVGTKTESSSLEDTEMLEGNNDEERTPNSVVQSLDSSNLDDIEMEEVIEDQEEEDEGIIPDLNTPLASVEYQECSELKEIETEMKDIEGDEVQDDNEDGEEVEAMILDIH